MASQSIHGFDTLKEFIAEGHRQYSEIKAAGGIEWQRLVEKGRFGRIAGNAGGASFGRHRRRDADRAFSARGGVAALGRDARDPEADNIMVAAFREEPLSEALAAISAEARATTCQLKLKNMADESRLAAWSEERSRQLKQTKAFPESAGWRPVACEGLTLGLEVSKWSMPLRAMANQFLSWCPLNLRLAMDAEWKRRHAIVNESEDPAETTNLKIKICRAIGMCVCSMPQMCAFVRKLQGGLRTAFKKGTTPRLALDAGLAVLRFVSNAPGEGEDDRSERYVHLSYQNLTTWRSSLLPLMHSRDQVSTCVAKAGGRVALAPAFLEDMDVRDLGLTDWWRMFKDISLQQAWSFKVMQIYTERQPLLSPDGFVPANVQAEPTYPLSVIEFWHGLDFHTKEARTRAARSAAKRRRAEPAGAEAAAVLPDRPLEDWGQSDDEQAFELDVDEADYAELEEVEQDDDDDDGGDGDLGDDWPTLVQRLEEMIDEEDDGEAIADWFSLACLRRKAVTHVALTVNGTERVRFHWGCWQCLASILDVSFGGRV
jgi:hypothetical protein